MGKVIWQTEDGKIYIGFTVYHYAIPVQEFKTFSEFTEYVRGFQSELIMYYDFIQQVLSTAMPKLNKIESYINTLGVIDNIGRS